jgi:hypothetical protein
MFESMAWSQSCEKVFNALRSRKWERDADVRVDSGYSMVEKYIH